MSHQIVTPPKTWELKDRKFGGLRGPDPHDSRDLRAFEHRKRLSLPLALPPEANFNHFFYPDLYDQGSIGSCVAWGWRRVNEFVTAKSGHERQPLSPLWMYAVARDVAGYPVTEDTGLYIRDGERITRGRGFAREEDWPYNIRKAFEMPPSSAYLRALWYRNRRTYRIESILEMKAVIAAGHPVVFGFDVHESFYEAAGNGNVPPPSGALLGGHCCAGGRYKDDSAWPGGGFLEGPNSWGDWTPGGLLRWSYDFLQRTDAFPDMWTVAWNAADQPPEM